MEGDAGYEAVSGKSPNRPDLRASEGAKLSHIRRREMLATRSGPRDPAPSPTPATVAACRGIHPRLPLLKIHIGPVGGEHTLGDQRGSSGMTWASWSLAAITGILPAGHLRPRTLRVSSKPKPSQPLVSPGPKDLRHR